MLDYKGIPETISVRRDVWVNLMDVTWIKLDSDIKLLYCVTVQL